jgi:protein disulfide-isomerase-like protein
MGSRSMRLLGVCLFFLYIPSCFASKCTVAQLSDHKDHKKFVKSRSNILVVFVNSDAEINAISNGFLCETIDRMKGQFDVSFVNCEGGGRKLCKQQKVNPAPSLIYHYTNGEFNVEYDRPHSAKSLSAFLKNPSGESPWSDDPSATSVTHVEDMPSFSRLISRPKLPVLVMFYAPWCGHCKRMKPQYVLAAYQAKDNAVVAAMDVSTDEFSPIRYQYNISGFPTLIYFVKGQPLYVYSGEQTSAALVAWLSDPKPFETKTPVEEAAWEETDANQHVKFLTDDTFDEFIVNNPSVYLMVYAPWCGHCKRMKPDYEEAARELAESGVGGVLAALDATKSRGVADKLGVTGYPSVKYFQQGEQPAWPVNFRTKDTILTFMLDPKEPPAEPKEVSWEEEASDVVFLNSDNFLTALKKKKVALVMFFTPWCGHCKKAKPEFSMAATQLKTQAKVLLGAIDCTQQTDLCAKHGVTGYPTLKIFSYGKNPADYSGGRTQGDFVDYINSMVRDSRDEL